MVSIARRNLFGEPTRLAITIGGVALSIMLIIVLWSLYQGWSTKIYAYIDSVDADIWVGQEGAIDMSHSISLVPGNTRATLQGLPGVQRVQPLIGWRLGFTLGSKEIQTFLIGFDQVTGVGGPAQIVSGRGVAGRGEIVVDRVFARNNGLKVGSTLTMLGHPLRVVGITSDTNLVIYQYSFVHLADAQAIVRSPDFVNYYLVDVAPEADTGAVQAAIDALPGIQAVSKAEYREMSRRVISTTFLPIIVVLVAVGVIVGVAVIGLTIYTGTVEKSREYGVLKAIGASNWRLYAIVLEQAVLVGIVGYAVGVGLSFVAIAGVERAVPAFITVVRPMDLVTVLGVAVAMATAASYVPVRRLVRIDPAIAFKQ